MKLFLLKHTSEDFELQRSYAKEAVACVQDVLGVDQFDILILSLPGIALEKDEKDYNSKDFPVPEETIENWIKTWQVLGLSNIF